MAGGLRHDGQVSGQLRVDLGALDRTAHSLAALRAEFANAGHIVTDAERAIGAKPMIDALEDFSTNWKLHREKLLSAMDAVQAMAAQSAATYRQVDDELTRALTDASAGPPGR